MVGIHFGNSRDTFGEMVGEMFPTYLQVSANYEILACVHSTISMPSHKIPDSLLFLRPVALQLILLQLLELPPTILYLLLLWLLLLQLHTITRTIATIQSQTLTVYRGVEILWSLPYRMGENR